MINLNAKIDESLKNVCSLCAKDEIEKLKAEIDDKLSQISELENYINELKAKNDNLVNDYNDLVSKYNKDAYEVQESGKISAARYEDKIKELEKYINELEEANISFSYQVGVRPSIDVESRLARKWKMIKSCFFCERHINEDYLPTCEDNMNDHPVYCGCEHWK